MHSPCDDSISSDDSGARYNEQRVRLQDNLLPRYFTARTSPTVFRTAHSCYADADRCVMVLSV